MRFKRQKYTDLIMYILSKSANKPNFGKTVLCSIMYFIDFNYYECYGKLMTNETYIKSRRGIKPIHFREVSDELISKNQLFFRKEPYYNRIIYKYYPLIIPNIKFKLKELDIINYSINKLSNKNATSITRYAIKDPPITIAKLGDEIDFRYVFSRDNEYSLLNEYIY
ncbi:type II toxin-antitoxin system antitoxin SocA domain-containing protein [Methanobrevibacter sp.]|uniref:type II toxin-antitoxin system antitoxin SocA domain-containing protein n=1 Tax=Methanobrevibacter sp. TaxID=66852 RepID=UPI003867E7CD